MRRGVFCLVGPACFLALLLIVYRPVLFADGQFASSTTSHFYPLYQRVQQEWDAGRWPLWDPGHNAGQPLLGDPMAAVLYPGKVLYAALPYAWAARLYVIVHTIVAFLGLLALARSCGLSWVGSCLGGLSYAFGAPVLLLYGNPLVLVGAAWIPWGLCAIDHLLRQGRRRGMVGLGVVLAMQVLDGDAQAAYLTALCGAGYALVLTGRGGNRRSWVLTRPMVLGAVGLWVAATLGLASPRIVRPGLLVTKGLVLTAWVAAILGLAWHWHRHRAEARLAPRLARLMGACALALALAAVQLLPVLEFTGRTWRAAGISATNLYRYSLDPWRIAELVWPNIFGTSSPESRSWLQAIPPVGGHELWVDSVYLGGFALVLALSAAGWRGGPPWRAWLTTVAVVALAASLGKYGSPLWWARWGLFPATLGPHDPPLGQPRPDELLPDGAGSPYGLLAMLLPGFDAFRYPAKLATFTAAGLAVLAGVGWDRATSEAPATRRLRRLSLAGLGASLVGLIAAWAARGRAVAHLAGQVPGDPMFGPADVAGAWGETERALAHGAIVFAASLALARAAPRRPRIAGALALVFLAVDLALANARLVRTAPQADFEAPSEAARCIEAAERAEPAPGPFRVHRMPGGWFPLQFATTGSAHRYQELTAWARATLFPLYGLPMGLEYSTTIGSLEIEDYTAFFHPQPMPVPRGMARVLGVPASQPVIYFPRRSFDLWGARYFLLPAVPDWISPDRGFASFLDQTELIHPSPEVLSERQSRDGSEPWGVRQDWQLRRNRAAYPRAWIVHHARIRPPARDPDARARLTRTLVFMNDPMWIDPDRTVLDLRALALIETDDKESLQGFLSPRPVGPSESVAIVKHEPQRVELRATLDWPGLVILADTFYPGWHLTIDGRPAPIWQANRIMRGAAVPAGEHTLIYAFQPASFRIGAIVSTAGVIALVALLGSSRQRSEDSASKTP